MAYRSSGRFVPLEDKFVALTVLVVGCTLLVLAIVLIAVVRNSLFELTDQAQEAGVLIEGSGYFYRISLGIMGIMTIGFVSLILSQRALMRRMVTDPLEKFMQASQEVAEGNLTHHVQVSTRDEMGKLASLFNEMTDKLNRSISSLSELKNFNEHVLESMNSGIMVIGMTGEIRLLNSAVQKILGLGEVVGQYYKDALGEGEFPSVLGESLRSLKAASRMELKVSNAGGEQLILGASTSILLDHGGQPIGVIVIFTNLTRIKELEKKARLNEHLASLGELTAGVVHEVRNPLSAISGSAQLLQRQLRGDASKCSMLQDILHEVSMLDTLIHRLLTFAKPFDLKKETTTASNVISRALKLAETRLADNSIATKTLCNDSVAVCADEEKLTQLLLNIVNNAVDAMPSGGTLLINAHPVSAHNTTGKPDALDPGNTDGYDLLEITVSDTGKGILPEDRSHIFSPFFTTKESGTGLGLAIAQKIAVEHGGTINVESTVGKGTSFHITIPLH